MSEGWGSGAPTSSPDEVEGILAQFPEIPSVPGVLVRIWTLVEDPQTSVSDLEKVVRVEPPLAAKVLRVANSAYFGGRGRIHTVHGAITVLGFDTLRNLAVSMSVARSVEPALGHESLRIRELWRHSVATGVLAKCLAGDLGLSSPEELFTAGLLHDMGMVVIALARPDAYREITARALADDLSLVEAERSILGFDHALVGEAFARAWAFPLHLQSLIRHHHDPDLEAAPRSVQVLALADGWSRGWLDTSLLPPLPQGGPPPELPATLGLDSTWVDAHRESYLREIAAADELVALV